MYAATEKWVAKDGTAYGILVGTMDVIEYGQGYESEPEGSHHAPLRKVLSEPSQAVGHLKEALEAGFELIAFNLRPGKHVLRKKA